MSAPLLEVEELRVVYGARAVVDGVSFSLARGEAAALVGASGSGKSQTALALLGLNAPGARLSGAARFAGENLLTLPRRRLDALRGRRIAMAFQEPAASLDPFLSVGAQLCAVLRLRAGLSRTQARARAIDLFGLARLPEPERKFDAFPHQLSGGQLQRVAIAMALSCEPALLLADEPTSALDATVAAQVMELLDELRRRLGLAVLIITHDLPLARRFAGVVHVMADGRLVEGGAGAARPLAAAAPRGRAPAQGEASGEAAEILRLERVSVRAGGRGLFAPPSREILKGVSLTLERGRTLAVVGESGAGKTTLARAALRLAPSEGSIRFMGREIGALPEKALRPLRRDMQMVFQDPFGALSPRLRVADVVAEGLAVHEPSLSRRERDEAAAEALRAVGLDPARRFARPSAFSGGQRQRIALARALILAPRLVVLDEPTSALDEALRGDVLRLIAALQRERGLSYLLVTHDLAAARALAHRVAVMKDGEIVETGAAEEVLEAPRHAYARALVEAARRLGGGA